MPKATHVPITTRRRFLRQESAEVPTVAPPTATILAFPKPGADPCVTWAERNRAIMARLDELDEHDPRASGLWAESSRLEHLILTTPATSVEGARQQIDLVCESIEVNTVQERDPSALLLALTTLALTTLARLSGRV